MSRAQEVKQSLDEVQSLSGASGNGELAVGDWGILQRVLRAYERLLSTLLEAQITLQTAPDAALWHAAPAPQHRYVWGL